MLEGIALEPALGSGLEYRKERVRPHPAGCSAG
jgi:hypothetical protein